jgi:hypothetical protein
MTKDQFTQQDPTEQHAAPGSGSRRLLLQRFHRSSLTDRATANIASW